MYLRRHKTNPFTATVRRDLISVILNMLFTNFSRNFLTNIDWLLQSHGSIGHFYLFTNPIIAGEEDEYKVYSMKSLKTKLQQKLGDHVFLMK